jgi:hypothetical protein
MRVQVEGSTPGRLAASIRAGGGLYIGQGGGMFLGPGGGLYLGSPSASWPDDRRPAQDYRIISFCRLRGSAATMWPLAWRGGDHLDFLLLRFLSFPIASLLAVGHVNLPWV